MMRSPSRSLLSPVFELIGLVPFLPHVSGVSSEVDRPSKPLERLLGRSIALFVHPRAVWRSRRGAPRIGLLVAYFVASYIVSLGLLLLLSA